MKLLTVKEAGDYLKRSPQTIRKLIHDGLLPAKDAGRGFVIADEDLHRVYDKLPTAQRTAPAARDAA